MMNTVISKDGTKIAYWRKGSGADLLEDGIIDRFENMITPTLLLVGGDSPQRELDDATVIANALPDARVSSMPGQQHAAMYTAPELFVHTVLQFIEE
jgi:pimeloyl-ACP methyl ester carboxylesterase